jgi:hypothetical protein
MDKTEVVAKVDAELSVVGLPTYIELLGALRRQAYETSLLLNQLAPDRSTWTNARDVTGKSNDLLARLGGKA